MPGLQQLPQISWTSGTSMQMGDTLPGNPLTRRHSIERKKYAAALRSLRELDALSEVEKASRFFSKLNVIVGGNVSGEFIIPGARMALAEAGINAALSALPFDSWIPVATSGEVQADVWIVWISAMGASIGQTARPQIDVDAIASAATTLIGRGATFILLLPEALPAEGDPTSPFVAWRRRLVFQLVEAMPPSAVLISAETFQRNLGTEQWQATRYWTMAKCPSHPDAATELGYSVGKILAKLIRPDVKAIICDLDDTIWGGVVGEVGPDGLKLDPNSDGAPFLALQRMLKDAIERGIPVSVVSKNEREQAIRPFLERDEMILKLDDLVFFEASWESKHGAIKKIATELNLAIDQICFLDDSSFERDQAISFLPGLIVPDLHLDPEMRIEQLIQSYIFQVPLVRADDRNRTEMYKAERTRTSERANFRDAGQYLHSLEMSLIPHRIDAGNISRVASLVQKTNQFNVTNLRLSSKEILSIADDNANYAFAFSIEDKFGTSGLISVLLGKPSGKQLDLLVWVLSCRVFNRTAEHAAFEHLINWMRKSNLESVACKFVTTKKNRLVGPFLKSIGLQSVDASDLSLMINRQLVPPDHYLELG